MISRTLHLPPDAPYRRLVGVGGIGSGLFFALEGNHTLGRNESRPGRLLDVRDYCKLHIIAHYTAVLLGAQPLREQPPGAQRMGEPFHVLPIGRVGADATGERMRQEMAAAGMDVSHVRTDPERPTMLSVCFQYPDGAGGNITATDAAASALTPEDVDCAAPYLAAGRAVALAAPEVPLEARLRLLDLATAHGALRAAALATAEVVTARELGLLDLVDLLALNEDEGAALVGEALNPERPEPFLARVAEALTAHQPGMRIVVSAGPHGAYGYEGGVWDYCPTPRVRVASTAGAGDALLGTVIAGLAAGLPLIRPSAPRAAITARPLDCALDLAVLLAAFTVTSPHTIHPGANVDSLCAFAEGLGVAFGEPLQAIVAPR